MILLIGSLLCPVNTAAGAAGTNVSFLVTAQNTGNLILQAVNLTSPELGSLNCTQPAHVPVRGSLQCSAVSNFDQDDMEGGDQTFTAFGASATLPLVNATVTASPQVIHVMEVPQLVVDVVGAECTKPTRMREWAGRTWTCNM